MRLFLVRHGQTHANVARQLDTAVPGLDLTDAGHEQARALAERHGMAATLQTPCNTPATPRPKVAPISPNG